jgi:hypothetical protein
MLRTTAALYCSKCAHGDDSGHPSGNAHDGSATAAHSAVWHWLSLPLSAAHSMLLCKDFRSLYVQLVGSAVTCEAQMQAAADML